MGESGDAQIFHDLPEAPLNIKKQILEYIRITPRFAFTNPLFAPSKFLRLVETFFSATTIGQSERYARRLMNFILAQHEKSASIGAVLEPLNNAELYSEYKYRKQRLHFTHLANVLLLGLYIYHNFPPIKEAIIREMQVTTQWRELKLPCERLCYRYSGGNEYGEFLFRWKLASLSHDVGYGISLAGNNEGAIRDYLLDISAFLFGDIDTLPDLFLYNGKDLLMVLDDSMHELSIREYMEYQLDNPFPDSVHRDHGIISSLILLRVLHEEYAKHELTPVTTANYSQIIWHESFLETSILQSAIAISFHNLNQHEDALRIVSENSKIFNIENRPLCWLLKVADTLQEWDKPLASESTDEELDPVTFSIHFQADQIVIRNMNDKDRDSIILLRDNNFSDSKFLSFE